MTSSKRPWIAVLAVVSLAGLARAHPWSGRDRADAKRVAAPPARPAIVPSSPAIDVAPPPPPSAPAAAVVVAPDRVAALRDALAWPDDAARIDAVGSAVTRGAVETLPLLEATELKRDPEAAPAIIHAVAALGVQAPGDGAARAASTLAGWLRDESGRDAADARGNVSLLVDALGQIGGAGAVDALAGALDGRALPLHVETLAVQDLAALGDPRARDAVARFAARVAALPKADGLDEELRQEAIAAAASAEDRLSP